jgi:hypothetical protein
MRHHYQRQIPGRRVGGNGELDHVHSSVLADHRDVGRAWKAGRRRYPIGRDGLDAELDCDVRFTPALIDTTSPGLVESVAPNPVKYTVTLSPGCELVAGWPVALFITATSAVPSALRVA